MSFDKLDDAISRGFDPHSSYELTHAQQLEVDEARAAGRDVLQELADDARAHESARARRCVLDELHQLRTPEQRRVDATERWRDRMEIARERDAEWWS